MRKKMKVTKELSHIMEDIKTNWIELVLERSTNKGRGSEKQIANPSIKP